MNTTIRICPECAAIWRDGKTCEDHFHQMLAWEFEDPGGAGALHHLTVLCYYIQHPSHYSPEALAHAEALLEDFVAHGVSSAEVRERSRDLLDSGKRNWKVTGEPASHGRVISWEITAGDVTVGGLDGYTARIEAWARAVLAGLRAGA